MFIPIYFFKYRGIASGFIYAGAGVFGLACPTLIDMSLKSIDWRWTLRIVALFVLVFCLGSSFVIRPRHSTDDARSYASLSRKDFAFIKNKRFLIMAGAVLFQGLGFFVPNLFIQRKFHTTIDPFIHLQQVLTYASSYYSLCSVAWIFRTGFYYYVVHFERCHNYWYVLLFIMHIGIHVHPFSHISLVIRSTCFGPCL